MARTRRISRRFSDGILELAKDWNGWFCEVQDRCPDLYERYKDIIEEITNMTVAEQYEFQAAVNETAISVAREYYENKAKQNKEEA